MFPTPHTLAAGWHNQRHAQNHICAGRAGRAVGGGSFFHALTVRPNTQTRIPNGAYGALNSAFVTGHLFTLRLGGGVVGSVANTAATVDRRSK
jgi:hypothetical protein